MGRICLELCNLTLDNNMLTFPVMYNSFNPRQLGTQLVGWWDGSNPSGNGVIPSNGTSISTFVDLSSYENNFTQATGGSQPTFIASAKNGMGALNLSSTLTMATANPPNGFTFTTNPRSLILVFAFTTAVSSQNNIVWNQGGAGNGNNSVFGHFNAGGTTLGVDSGGSGQYITFNAVTNISQNTFYVWEYYCASGTLSNSTGIVNGSSTGAISHGYTGGTVASSAITIGGLGGLTLCEIIACNQQLNTSQQNLTRAYLRNKWAI